ncbi:hypothetical protein BH09SUM1_BH09SUM1_17800 [soil metagenome]
MPDPPLHDQILSLTEQASAMLARWLVLFETRLAEAESSESLLELKELVQFLTALERSLKIARLADLLRPKGADGSQHEVDPEALRRILLDED